MGIFKNTLRTLRTSQGLTQEELAKRFCLICFPHYYGVILRRRL